ncbi:MAG: hypothetical protein JRH20_31145, partial [Deltaproteobacteria bacterium]|nr:hypothetical protein [Deltaproteobacteria bacterium]
MKTSNRVALSLLALSLVALLFVACSAELEGPRADTGPRADSTTGATDGATDAPRPDAPRPDLGTEGLPPDSTPAPDGPLDGPAPNPDVTVPADVSVSAPGPKIGTLWNTYYWVSLENDFSGSADTVLYDAACQPIVTVTANFSDSVCIEGSGRLSDGRMINYEQSCSCGRPCPTGGIVCYSVLDIHEFPWGMGATSNALQPLVSLAVDKDVISLGQTLYLPLWDGVKVPAVDGLGGTTHDGCFRADDVGGSI